MCLSCFFKVHRDRGFRSWGNTQPIFIEQEKMSNRIIWDYCKDEGGGSSLEFCTVCPFWELIWVVCMVIPSIVLPYGAGRLKVSCSFSYRSRIKNKQSNTQLSQEEGGKEWFHFYGNTTLQPFVLTMKLASQGLYLGARERRRDVPGKKNSVYLG